MTISYKNERIIANFDNITLATPLVANTISDIDGDLDKEVTINAPTGYQPVLRISLSRNSQLTKDFLNNKAMKWIVETRNDATNGTFLNNSLILKTDVQEFGEKTISNTDIPIISKNNRQKKILFGYSKTKLPELLKAFNSGEGSYFEVMVAQNSDALSTLIYDNIALVPYNLPIPTRQNWAYGTKRQQVLDVYQAESDKPTPVVFDIHGGGFITGNKGIRLNIAELVGNGISVVQMDYSYLQQAYQEAINPPIEEPMSDIIRAIQFILYHADELNIDKKSIGVTGESAGGYASLLLGLKDDYANPESSDPIERESTSGIKAIVPRYIQTTMDPVLMRQWLNPENDSLVESNIYYGSEFFGYWNPNTGIDITQKKALFNQWVEDRNQNTNGMLDQIIKYSPNYQVTSDDPPVFLDYAATNLNQNSDYIHHPLFGVNLYNLLQNAGVESYLRLDNYSTPYSDYIDFLLFKLIERNQIEGSQGNDTLIGTEGIDVIIGKGGNDQLDGGGGNDIIDGGAGIDRMIITADVNWTLNNSQLMGQGTDKISNIEKVNINGGNSNNTLDASGFSIGSVYLSGADGQDLLLGGSGNDFLAGGGGDDTLTGGGGIDQIIGNGNRNFILTNNELTGNGTTDVLSNIETASFLGGNGNNVLNAIAFSGAVILNGSDGNDTLLGGSSKDSLMGDVGNDIFVFKVEMGQDIITDFEDGVDKLGLSSGLTFNNLSIRSNGNNTLISYGENILASLLGINPNLITQKDFVIV